MYQSEVMGISTERTQIEVEKRFHVPWNPFVKESFPEDKTMRLTLFQNNVVEDIYKNLWIDKEEKECILRRTFNHVKLYAKFGLGYLFIS